eukprot:TRINITY_DN16435_c0_g1_i1.p1 TRINITY_DN16435_c0_g1~~TRINITY_DN16435_c0_g1_i1.p1  ORF type:complete len:638 (-),score=95.03 TRINITY_DN16435_c0_g1_i1:81-1925(-)
MSSLVPVCEEDEEAAEEEGGVSMDDFEIGQMVGRRRPGSAGVGEGDLVSAVHSSTGEVVAMKRIEVDVQPAARSREMLASFTRSRPLRLHKGWIQQRYELSFVHNYRDALGCPRKRLCIVEELADCNMQSDVVMRAVGKVPAWSNDDLFRHWAELLHGLQAYHTQDFLHRDICLDNVLMKAGVARLGSPGLEEYPPAVGYYPGNLCQAYSADIFALGVVFLEMATLRPASEWQLPGEPHSMLITELLALDGSAASFSEWLRQRSEALGTSPIHDAVCDVLASMLTVLPHARPTADDLLDLPVFAPYVDPAQVLPVMARPCVLLAHDAKSLFPDLSTGTSASSREPVPRRCTMALPQMQQLFCTEGGERALKDRCYTWRGTRQELWWLEKDVLAVDPDSPQGSPAEEDLQGLLTGAADAQNLISAAAVHRAQGRLIAAEVCWRRGIHALRHAEEGTAAKRNLFKCWLGLASTIFERGNYSAAYLAYCEAVKNSERAPDSGAASENRLWGLCDFFQAVDEMCAQHERPGGALGAHTHFYSRSLIALEVGNWEVMVALGEFYRLVGCVTLPCDAPAPDLSTALSYFEQADSMRPGARIFLEDRLLRLETQLAAGGHG